MKPVWKSLQISILIIMIVFYWMLCALMGFIFTFYPPYQWMYNVTPFIGFLNTYLLIREIIRIYKA